MKKMMTRALSAALALTMCVGLLNLPAFAATATVLTCGTPEHSHTSACYTETSTLTCTESTEDKMVTETVTETVTDEEGNETEVSREVTKVVPGHSHGAGCYSSESVLTCTAAEHTHSSSCYSEEREVNEDDGTVTVTPPSEFTIETKDEAGETSSTQVKVDGDKATVTVDGKEIEATVKAEVISKPVNTTVSDEGTTTSEETRRVTNPDGSVTVYTEYTTTYTTEVTTGYWVTYTVTYMEPTTYTVEKDDGLDVTVDENGDITVNGVGGDAVKDDYKVTVNGVIGEGENIGNYPITSENGKFYVTIDNQKYEVLPTVGRVDGEDNHYMVSWSFADENTKIEIADGTQETSLPDGVEIKDGNVTLKSDVTIDGNKFVVEDGKTYIVVKGLKYEVTLTASGDAANGYTLSWDYNVMYLPSESLGNMTFDKDVTQEVVGNLGSDNGRQYEFVAIQMPDGTYAEVARGADKYTDNWLTGKDVTANVVNGRLQICYSTEDNQNAIADYYLQELVGCTSANVILTVEPGENNGYDYLIVKIAGIIVTDNDGNEKAVTLTVADKKVTIKTTAEGDSASVGGTETKYVTISSLTGSAHVSVMTQDGKEVTMTYSEYLEATAEGENLELKGVLESSIPSPDQTTPPSGGSNEPVIPVIPTTPPVTPTIPPVVIDDGDVPLSDVPDVVVVDDGDVPLSDVPDVVVVDDSEVPLSDVPDVVVIDDGDVPLSDVPDVVVIDDVEVPLADVPQTGDISSMWYVVSVLSAAGFLVLTALERRQRRQA